MLKLNNSEVRIETTTFCNANCTICARDKMTRPKCTMSYEHFTDLVRQADKLGADLISPFGFGEPLMDKGIADKIKFCTSLGIETFLTTNAGLLDTQVAGDLLRAGLTRLRVSAHGLAEHYEDVHRGLSWKNMIRNVFNFIQMNKIRHDGECNVDVSIIPMHGETIQEIQNFWSGRVDNFEIWKPHNWTDLKGYRELKPTKKTCGRPFNGPVQINADGKMMVCCFDSDATLTVGDTNTHTIEQILKGMPFNIIRDKHRTGNLRGLICEHCDQLNQDDNPLLFSTIDSECTTGKTSSTKFKL